MKHLITAILLSVMGCASTAAADALSDCWRRYDLCKADAGQRAANYVGCRTSVQDMSAVLGWFPPAGDQVVLSFFQATTNYPRPISPSSVPFCESHVSACFSTAQYIQAHVTACNQYRIDLVYYLQSQLR